MTIPITLNFSQDVIGSVCLSDQTPLPPNLNEYFIVPTTRLNDEGTFEVIEYSLVIRNFVAPAHVLEQREREATE